MENWKWLPNYEGMYEISDYGRARSYVRSKSPRQLRTYKDPRGYVQLVITVKGKARTFWMHRLVAQLFVPNPNNLPEVNHKDAQKGYNHYSNLEWVTPSNNIKHAYSLSLIPKTNMPKGTQHYAHKLTPDLVKEIRDIYSSGEMGSYRLAKRFKVSKRTILGIIHRTGWAHVA